MPDSWNEIDDDGMICDWDETPSMIAAWHMLEMVRRGIKERQDCINYYYSGIYDFEILRNPFEKLCGDIFSKMSDMLDALIIIRKYFGLAYQNIIGITVGDAWHAMRLGSNTTLTALVGNIEKLHPIKTLKILRDGVNEMVSIIPYPIIDTANPDNFDLTAYNLVRGSYDGSVMLYTQYNLYDGNGWISGIPAIGGAAGARAGAIKKSWGGIRVARVKTRTNIPIMYHSLRYDLNMFGAAFGVYLDVSFFGDVDFYGNSLLPMSKLHLLTREINTIAPNIGGQWFSGVEYEPDAMDKGYQIQPACLCVTQEPHFNFHL